MEQNESTTTSPSIGLQFATAVDALKRLVETNMDHLIRSVLLDAIPAEYVS